MRTDRSADAACVLAGVVVAELGGRGETGEHLDVQGRDRLQRALQLLRTAGTGRRRPRPWRAAPRRSIGVKMKSTAPLAYAVAVSVSSRPKAVRKMIGVCSRLGALADQPGRLVAVQDRHPTSIRITAKLWLQRRRAAPPPRVGLDDRVAERREHRADREALAGVVVDDQDRGRRRAAAGRLDRRGCRHQPSTAGGSRRGQVRGATRRATSSRLGGVDGLGDVGGRARVDAALALARPPPCAVTAMIGRSSRRRQLAHGPHRLVAVHDRHHDVHRARCRCPASRSRIVEPSCAALGRDHLELAALEQRGEREDVADVVVDHQHLHARQAGARRMRASARQRRGGRLHRDARRSRGAGAPAARRRRRAGAAVEREVDGEGAALVRARCVSAISPPSSRTSSRLIDRPEPGAAVLAGRRAVGLREGLEHRARCSSSVMPMPVSVTLNAITEPARRERLVRRAPAALRQRRCAG